MIVALEGSNLLVSAMLPTASPEDRFSLEPYRAAVGDRANAAAIVAEGRASQERIAAESLTGLIARLRRKPSVAGLLVNRAGWVTDLLSYSLEWADHVPVAELLAVREALRHALRQCGIALVEIDEKSLDPSSLAIDAHGAKPWRKEQKLACLAALAALSETR